MLVIRHYNGKAGNTNTGRKFFFIKVCFFTQRPVPETLLRKKPSIETAKKLADALAVSLDYLVGDGDLKVVDKKTMQRLEDIEKLPLEDKAHIFYALDNLIKAAKYKAI